MNKIFYLLFFLITSSLNAELLFDTVYIKRRIIENESDVVSTISFTNTGTKPVNVKKINTPCGCTIANTDKKTYLPQESGALSVVFSLESLGTKNIVRFVEVITDDNTELLTFEYIVPTIFQIMPNKITWAKTTNLESKIALIKNSTDKEYQIINVESTNKFFNVEIKKLDPKTWKLIISPENVVNEQIAQPIESTIKITTNYKINNKPLILYISAEIL